VVLFLCVSGVLTCAWLLLCYAAQLAFRCTVRCNDPGADVCVCACLVSCLLDVARAILAAWHSCCRSSERGLAVVCQSGTSAPGNGSRAVNGHSIVHGSVSSSSCYPIKP
jgi:hypothetical protein